MKKLAKDIKVAARLFLAMRNARKDGAEVVLEKKRIIPAIQPGGFYGTVEGCVLSHLDREIALKAHEAYKTLPDGVKHQLQFSPEGGEFKERAKLWRDILSSLMDEKQCHIAMYFIVNWYIHIKQIGGEK